MSEDILNRLQKIENKLINFNAIEYENMMHDAGYRPCDGVWDRNLGICIPILNTPPVVNAGPDLSTNTGELVQMVGAVTDAESNIKSLTWTQLSGTSVTLNVSVDGTTAKFTPMDAGTYSFLLTAIDSGNLKGEDDIIVNVTGAPTSFAVDAGIDQAIETEIFPVGTKLAGRITGNLSILNYGWTGLPNIPKMLNPIVSFDQAGEYNITLTATTVTGLTKSDTVKIKVTQKDISQPVINVNFPSTIEILKTGVIDASTSVADTITVTETTGKDVNLTETSRWKWNFTPPAAVTTKAVTTYQLGFKLEAKKGSIVSSRQVSIQVTKPDTNGGEVDQYGIKWLVGKGQQSLITMSRDEATDDRWSGNIDLRNGFEATFIGKSIGTNSSSHFAMKQGGSNHSKGDWQNERWLDTGLRSNGEVQLQYEGPHPSNHDFTLPASKQFIKNIGKGLEGNWIGLKWCQQILKPGGSPANGGVRWRMWVDKNAINASGKPSNNWELVYDFIDGVDVQVIQPQTFVTKGTMDAEVRRSDTNTHDVFGDGRVYTNAQDGTPGLHVRALGGTSTGIKKVALSEGHKIPKVTKVPLSEGHRIK